MRTLIKVEIPVEAGNAAIKSGSFQQTMRKAMEDLKPEAAYFGIMNGKRGGFLVADLSDASEMSRVAEPIFQLGGSVEISPVMTFREAAGGL
jgi:hypothetical protein